MTADPSSSRTAALTAVVITAGAGLLLVAGATRWLHILVFNFDPADPAAVAYVVDGLRSGSMRLHTLRTWLWAASLPAAAAIAAGVGWAAVRLTAPPVAFGLDRLRNVTTNMTPRARGSDPCATEASGGQEPGDGERREMGLGAKGRRNGESLPRDSGSGPERGPEDHESEDDPYVVLAAHSLAVPAVDAASVRDHLSAAGIDLAALETDMAAATPAGGGAPDDRVDHDDGVDAEDVAGLKGLAADDALEALAADDTDDAMDWDDNDDAPFAAAEAAMLGGAAKIDEASAAGSTWAEACAVGPRRPARSSIATTASALTLAGWTVQRVTDSDALAPDLILVDGQRVVALVVWDRPGYVHPSPEASGVPGGRWAGDLAPTLHALAGRETLDDALGESGLVEIVAGVVVGPEAELRPTQEEEDAWTACGVVVGTRVQWSSSDWSMRPDGAPDPHALALVAAFAAGA